MIGKLKFLEEFGELKFYYNNPNGRDYAHIKGVIPKEIVKLGKNSIKQYVKPKLDKAEKNWAAIERNIKKQRKKLKVKYEGKTLIGRITEITHRSLEVELQEPLMATGHMYPGFMGASFLDALYKISKNGYEAAQDALIQAYREASNQPLRDLAERLNKT